MARSIGSTLDANRGLGGGFDFLRVFLAFAVVSWHTWPISSGNLTEYNTHVAWYCEFWILFMFFALSGFLITGSALRLNLSNFLINRGLRIFPALGVEIVLSAFVIGPIFTTLPLLHYFEQRKVYHYLTNIVGVINYHLPGVFERNHLNIVNGSLWTVPYEMGCYAMMSAFIYFGLLKRKIIPIAIAAFVIAAGLSLLAIRHWAHWQPTGLLAAVLNPLFVTFESRLFVAFPLGIAAYLYRYSIPYSWRLFAASMGYLLLVAAIGHKQYHVPIVDALTAVPLTYVMVFVGVTKMRPIPFFHEGDYSYGIYLYGYPIQQMLSAGFPWLNSQPILLWLIMCPAITLFAFFSWHVIEKPIVKMRRKFSFVARQRLAEAPPEPELAGAEFDRPVIGEPASETATRTIG